MGQPINDKEILHELYIYCEWKPEPEFSQKNEITFPTDPRSVLHWLRLFGPERSLLECMLQWKENLTRWQIALSEEGKVLAVLADNILEIRTKRADFSTIVARTTLIRDAHPQLRKLVWSPDCSLLAVGHSNGTVAFYDLTATNLFNIPADCLQPAGNECKDTTHALASIIFIPPRIKNDKWSWEVLLITYNGKLRCYSVSQLDGSLLCHKFAFDRGVSSATFSYAHQLLCISGPKFHTSSKTLSGLDFGITAWRIINGEPHYKLSVASDQMALLKPSTSILTYIPFATNKKSSYIVCMKISHKDDKLACFDTAGEITIWRLPALQMMYRWSLEEQYSACNDGEERDKLQIMEQYAPVDLAWWDSDSITVSRANGSVTVCLLENINNILGKKPEYLKGTPQVTDSFDNSFLAFESESTVLSGNQKSESNLDVSVSTELVVTKPNFYIEVTKELVKWMLYTVTDLERFQPKPKKISLVSRVYRLLCIKSTTPDELYARKIEGGKYDEALTLADIYKLDKDLVYRQQWRSAPVSHRTIHKYLAQVSKKIWAVQQCVDRLPETLPAAKELLKFGLDLTDEEILNEVKSADSSVHCLDAVRAEHLNAHTRELLRCRHLMLFYLQRLQLYEDILKCEKSSYNREEYHRLRSNSLAHSAHELAKEGRIDALRCIWPQIRPESLQLSVLENLPEVIEPSHYKDLIPFGSEARGGDGRGDERRDWSQSEALRSVWQWTNVDEVNVKEGLVSESQACERSTWFMKRCKEIYAKSGLVTHARSLAVIGAKQGLELGKLIFDLETLELLVYDVGIEDITLDRLENSTVLEVCNTIMKKSNMDSFVEHLKDYLIPFLRRYAEFTRNDEDYFEALTTYLTQLSKTGLAHALVVLKSGVDIEINTEQHLELVQSCLLNYEGNEDIPKAYEILQTVPEQRSALIHSSGNITPSELLKRMSDLEKYIWACDVLSLHKVNTTIAALYAGEAAAISSLTHMARNVGLRNEKPEPDDWRILLSDMLELQEKVFRDVNIETCYQIYATALLTSGDQASIKMSSEFLGCTRSNRNQVPYDASVKCVLNAAREYFNSASELCDPSIGLARACLSLIKEDDKEIKEEMDLTTSLTILNEFGLTLLPIQVRLCTNKMELIQKCLVSSKQAYAATNKLLELATLLRISPDDEIQREGLVLTAAGSAALSAGAGNAAYSAARRLATLRYAPAAPFLCEVAALPAPANPTARRQLLAAAALHTNDLTNVIIARQQLELDESQRQMTIGDDLKFSKQESVESNEDEFVDAVTSPTEEKKGIFPTQIDEKFNKFSAFIAEQKWQSKLNLNWLNRNNVQQNETKAEWPEEQSFVEEFYATLYPKSEVNPQCYRYASFAGPDVDAPNSTSLLRAILLNYQLNGSKIVQLLSRAKDSISWSWRSDSALAVTLASLILNDLSENPEKSIPALPQLYASLMATQASVLKDEVFLTPPSKLLRNYYDALKTDPSLESNFIKQCTDRILKRHLAKRFGVKMETDDLHEEHTLKAIARTFSLENIETAVRLSDESSARSLWLEHVTALLSDLAPQLTHAQITERLNHQPLIVALKDPDIIERMKTDVWDKISGCDHTGLIHLLTLMHKVDSSSSVENIPVATHLKFVKKVKATSQELDYKILIKGTNVFDHFLDVATPNNIGSLAKLLRAAPANINLQVQPQQLYTTWLVKHLFSVCSLLNTSRQMVPDSAATSKKWMQQYRQCTSYFNKLNKENLVRFMGDAVFSREAILRIPENTRRLMLQQGIEYCQLEDENDRNFSNREDKSWQDVVEILDKWNNFLESLHSPTMQEIIQSNPHLTDDWVALETTRGNEDNLNSQLTQLLIDKDVSPIQLEQIYKCLNPSLTVQKHIIQIVEEESRDLSQRQLMRLCEVCAQCLNMSNVAAVLLAAKPPAEGRRLVLPLCQSEELPTGEDTSMLAKHSIELIQKEWDSSTSSIANLNEDSFSDPDSREKILTELIQNADEDDCWEKRRALVELICCWNESKPRGACYELIKMLIHNENNSKENGLHLKQLLRRKKLSEEETIDLLEAAPAKSLFCSLQMALMSDYDSAANQIPRLINRCEAGFNFTTDFDDDLIEELLNRGLFTKLVGTRAYAPIINYLVNNNLNDEAVYNTRWAVDELKKTNMLAEAGQLILLEMGVPTGLRNYTNSLLVHKRKNR